MGDPFRVPARIAIAGDWHGHGGWAKQQIRAAAAQGVNTLLQLGDFGLWPGEEQYVDKVNKVARESDMHVLWIDGNHETHDRIAKWPQDEPYTLRDHLWYLPRGQRWTWAGYEWLALGGAPSIDVEYRIPGRSWWPGETISTAHAERAAAGGPADIMLTHDCPDGVDIPTLRKSASAGWSEAALRAARQHRELLRAVVDAAMPAVLYHGHYHVRYDDVLYGHQYETQVHGLDCDGTDGNMLIRDLPAPPGHGYT